MSRRAPCEGSGTEGYNPDDPRDECNGIFKMLNGIMIKTQGIFEQMKGIASKLHEPVKKIDAFNKTLQRQFWMMQKEVISTHDPPEYDQENSVVELVPITRIRELVVNIRNLSEELRMPVEVLQALVKQMQNFSEESFIKKYTGFRVECIRSFAEQLISVTDKFHKPVCKLQALIDRFQEFTGNMQLYVIAEAHEERLDTWYSVVKSWEKTSDMVLQFKQLVETLSYKVNWFACKCQAFSLLFKPQEDEEPTVSGERGMQIEDEDECDHADNWVWAEPRLAVPATRTMVLRPSLAKAAYLLEPM
ncbi:uncharacterized protein LOC122254641 [Penaeus japonicus]|uniref:uncharacterized protein LOC122254641 n=1 Tax=Penaeus japonicus TaxID=27405 RepID=UPI001C71473B|nr:uncharacterized protein LOC122254641 [Penaeus japonicus]